MSLIFLPNATYKQRNVLPKTGQITSYQAGDDGDYEAGWWRKRLNANNKTRFVAKTIAGDDVVLDYATRLMWKATDEAPVLTWTQAVTNSEAVIWAGFTDWHLPNAFEQMTTMNFGAVAAPLSYAIFSFVASIYFTSTTYPIITTQCYYADYTYGLIWRSTKTNIPPSFVPFRVCREF